MEKSKVFQNNSVEYDNWFENNNKIYTSEISAIQSLLPEGMNGVEVGVGTGRFAIPLGIRVGVEPSEDMAELARARGVDVRIGVAERLPLDDSTFDFVLMVTAICFFNDVSQAFLEAKRVIRGEGFIVVSFIDKNSSLGKIYQAHKEKSPFYKFATFYSPEEVTLLLKGAGFHNFEYNQTVFGRENIIYETKTGYGEGGIVTVRAQKVSR